MTVKVTPAKYTTHCDRCFATCDDGRHHELKLGDHEQDYMWEYHAVPTRRFDLCDECYKQFLLFIEGHEVTE